MPPAIRDHLRAHLEIVNLPVGRVIYEPGGRLTHVYFPIDLIASLLYTTRNGSSSEIAIVGNDGMLGVAVCLGGDCTPDHAVVLSAGTAYRLKAHVLREEIAHSEALQRLLLRYVQALMTQTALVAACHRHHSVDQQLRRLLLMSIDRLSTNQLLMTHELIANSLGVRREGITEAAGRLQAAGIIAYRRGQITILDRNRLEQACCECYAVVKKEADFLLLPMAA
jgi:CRP-like cAMP-binding protein